MNTRVLTSTEAHRAFDSMMAHESAWAAESRYARSSAEFDRAMSWRWKYVDAATLAAQMHEPATCKVCTEAKR